MASLVPVLQPSRRRWLQRCRWWSHRRCRLPLQQRYRLRAGRHEYLDLATTSTPTASVAGDHASVPHASMVVYAQRSTSASEQQQQQQEDVTPRQAIENIVDNVLAAWTPTTFSTRCQSRDVTVSVSAPVSATTSASSEVTVGVVTECYYINLEAAAATSTLTSALDISGACSGMNSLALPTTSGCSVMVHTTCSTRCPSCDSSEESMLTSSAEPPSSLPTVDIVAEPATSVERDEAMDVAAPAAINCTTGGLDHNAVGNSMTPCLDPWSTPMLASYATTLAAATAAASLALSVVSPVNGNISITQEQTEETGNTHLIRDSLLMNSGFKFCLVKLLYQYDYAHEARAACHVIDTDYMMFVTHKKNDFEPSARHLLGTAQIFLMLPGKNEGAVNMQFHGTMHGVQVYWLLSSPSGYHRLNSWFLRYNSCNMHKCENDTHHDPRYFL
ncbi:hypothetical protein VPH35_059928 [Triticum aestivum]